MNIYVGNLPFSATEDQIRQLFSEFGQVESVSLITDRQTGRARGFGFVVMPDDAEAQQAIEQTNGKDMDERPLKVNEARQRASDSHGR